VSTPPQMIAIATQVRRNIAWSDVRWLCLAYLIAQVLDTLTTFVALSTQRFEETNPLFAGAIGVSPVLAVSIKMLAAVLVLVVALSLRIRWRLRRAVLVLLAIASLIAPMANALRLGGWL
jgi:hypothetical protein